MTQTPSEYAALVSAMLRRAAVSRQPAHGSFELTSRCNLSCRMCYVRQAAGDMTEAAKELSASAWLELARQATDNGMVFLLLTGGEIFLRRDFFEIYEPLTRMGLSIALFTNGTLITKDIAARLAQAPPSRAEITLYGATSATCEAVTGRPGSFAACCNGIEALLKHRITFSLKTTVTRQNVGELEAMRQMAHDWGVPFSASWLLTRRPDLTVSEVEDCRLSAEECIALEATDSASADEWTEAALRQSAEGRHSNFYCQAGKAAFAINPAGEMNACLLLPHPAALPLQTGFPDAWKVVQQYVDSAPPAGTECRDCDAFQYCGRCPAWSLVEKGTLTDAVPYLCEVARARRNHYEKPA